jgi:hypothetical protein
VAVDRNTAALKSQARTAQVSAGATLSMVKADKLLADAEEVLSGRAEEAALALRQQARAADEAADKTKRAGLAASSAGKGFGGLGPGMAAAVGAGVALAPVAVTLGAGLGGLGLAALSASKHTQAMATILGPLKQEVASFQGSLQPQVFTLFSDGAGIARDALRQLQPVAAATGKGLHGVLGDVGAELRSGQWQQFFQFMAAQAGPDLKLVDGLLVDLLKDVPPLLTQLQPLGRVVLILADDALKLVGGLERMHLVLPLVGAAIGFMVGGPLGALAGGLAGVALQAASANTQLSRTGQEVQHLSSLKPVTKDMVGFAAVAGEVALNLGRQPGAVQAVQNVMATAHPVVGTLAGDMATLNAAIGSGNSVLAAYSDLWDKFVGKSVSYQEAVLNLKAAFEGYAATVKQSGRTSTAAQQQFLNLFDVMKNGLSGLEQQGASVSRLNSYYQDAIARLNALHGLTPAQRADIAGLTQAYTAWASSVSGLNRNVVNAAHGLGQDMLLQVSRAHALVPLARADTDALANSILKTGTNSAATRADRATLIRDLQQSGLSAHAATALVDGLQRKIDAMHGKTVPVSVTASGSGGISVAAQGLAARIFKLSHLAEGGRLPGFGGGDIVPALLEPGEAVVDKVTTRRNAGVLKAMGVPGFAGGGIAGMPPWVAGQEGSVIGGWAGSDLASMLNSMIAAYKSTLAASGAFTPGAPATGSAAAAQAFARSILPAGWSWPALLSLWNQESGWNAWAVNPSSGAYGIPQSLGHGHPYNLGDYANQVRWGISYIAGRYGNSQNAWAHEQAFNWYGNGLDAVFGKPTIIGVGERGRERVTVTPAGKEPDFATLHEWLAAARSGKHLTAGQFHWLHVAHLQHLAHLAALGTLKASAPVAVIPPPRTTVPGHPPVRGGNGGGAGNTYNINVTVPPGTHPAQTGKAVVDAIREYERVNGKGWRG